MQLALVQGSTTTTIRHPSLANQRILICQALNMQGKTGGDPVLVIDQLGAGPGDIITITSDGLGLRELLNDTTSPARWWTVGIVDQADLKQSQAS
jgi:ethanolamine utilization protein EutN